MSSRSLTVVHLLPDLMNLYGDGGNVLALRRRCEWRGARLDVVRATVGVEPDLDACDILFMGGGQDRDQARVAVELGRYADRIRDWTARGGVALAVCGAFQLFGHSYVAADGSAMPGIGVFDAVTHAGEGRIVGDLVVDPAADNASEDGWLRSGSRPLIGFENHAGVTILGPGARPLGSVLAGTGNAPAAGVEGAVAGHAIGTYLHGALLPRNPWLADRLISAALERKHGERVALAELEDDLELAAWEAAMRRLVVA